MWTLHQFTPSFQPHDAIANQMAEMHRLALRMGAQARIWCAEPARRTDVATDHFTHYRAQAGDVALLHYGSGSVIDPFLKEVAATTPVALHYHNITPHHFLAPYNPPLAAIVKQGRDRIANHDFGTPPYSLVDSAYSRDELRGMGYTGEIDVLPCLVRTALLQSAQPAQRNETQWRDTVNWLFVGRLSPHKDQAAILHAFAHYHRHIEPRSRLILAGSARSAPGYQHYLRAWAAALGIEDALVFSQPNDAQLAAFYAAADVFVCLSQHEGFCVPLIEAMAFDVPIVALARTAVPDTLGNAGVLLDSNQPALVAEAVRLVLTRPDLRDSIVAAQRRQFQRFTPEVIEAQIVAALKKLQALADAGARARTNPGAR